MSNLPKKHKNLLLKEWVTIFLVLSFFCGIVLLGKGSEIHSKKNLACQLTPVEPMIEITLEGAVKRPGVYHCKPGTLFGDLVKEAGLLEKTKRGGKHFKKVLFSSQRVEIPSKQDQKKISLVEN